MLNMLITVSHVFKKRAGGLPRSASTKKIWIIGLKCRNLWIVHLVTGAETSHCYYPGNDISSLDSRVSLLYYGQMGDESAFAISSAC